MGIRAVIGIALALTLVQALTPVKGPAQTQDQDSKPVTFSVKVGLVVLPVAVLNSSGEFVPGLRREDFAVYEEGAPQSIELFDNRDIPVALGLMVDNSTSMGYMRSEVNAAAQTLAESSNSQDEIFVAHFFDRVVFSLQLGKARTRDLDRLLMAVSSTPGTGRTALYDAVYEGLDHASRSEMRKKVLVIISDGADNASRRTLEEALEKAKSSSSLIYSIGIYDGRNKDRSPKVLKDLAAISGGKAFFPENRRRSPGNLQTHCRGYPIAVHAGISAGQADPGRQVPKNPG